MIACTHINGYNMVEANFKSSAVPKVACLCENIFLVDKYGTCLIYFMIIFDTSIQGILTFSHEAYKSRHNLMKLLHGTWKLIRNN